MSARNEKVEALLFSVLMILSTIAPVSAMAASSAVGNDGFGSAVGNQPVDQPTDGTETEESNGTETATERPPVTDGPPAVQKIRALRIVADLDAGGNATRTNRTGRLVERLNATLSSYRDPTRVNESHAFVNDSVAVRTLAAYTNTPQEADAVYASRLVYQADNTTAHVAVADAEHALDRYGERMANQGRRNAAERHVENAQRALERAERINGSADGLADFEAQATAIQQLRTAHQQAHLALRFVDEETNPTITITRYTDPVRTGNNTYQYTVRGQIETVRPWTIENVSVTIDGTRTVMADTDIEWTAPARNASYRAQVNLTQRVVELIASVQKEPDRADEGDREVSTDRPTDWDEDEENTGNGPPVDRGNGNGPPNDRGNGNSPPVDRGNGNDPPGDRGNGNGPPEDRGNGNGPPADRGNSQTERASATPTRTTTGCSTGWKSTPGWTR